MLVSVSAVLSLSRVTGSGFNDNPGMRDSVRWRGCGATLASFGRCMSVHVRKKTTRWIGETPTTYEYCMTVARRRVWRAGPAAFCSGVIDSWPDCTVVAVGLR